MRNHMIDRILDWAHTDDRVVFLTGDLGFSVVEPLADQLGDRFINVGVAEANMVGMALGLAQSGMRPVVYTIAPFLYARALEQIRNDISQHKANVMMVGVGAGAMYGLAGPSHLALDDAHIISAMPNVNVYTPAGVGELDWCFDHGLAHDGPTYFRLGVAGLDDAPDHLGAISQWQQGTDINIVTTGAITRVCQDAAEQSGRNINLISLPLLSPVGISDLSDVLVDAPTLTVFEGFANNPLEAVVLKAHIHGRNVNPVYHINMGAQWPQIPGNREQLWSENGLTVDGICQAIQNLGVI